MRLRGRERPQTAILDPDGTHRRTAPGGSARPIGIKKPLLPGRQGVAIDASGNPFAIRCNVSSANGVAKVVVLAGHDACRIIRHLSST